MKKMNSLLFLIVFAGLISCSGEFDSGLPKDALISELGQYEREVYCYELNSWLVNETGKESQRYSCAVMVLLSDISDAPAMNRVDLCLSSFNDCLEEEMGVILGGNCLDDLGSCNATVEEMENCEKMKALNWFEFYRSVEHMLECSYLFDENNTHVFDEVVYNSPGPPEDCLSLGFTCGYGEEEI